MTFVDAMQGLRRRWPVAVVAAILVAVVAFLSAPAATKAGAIQQPAGVSYQATTTFLKDGDSSGLPSLALLRLFVTTGQIPLAVAKELGRPASDAALLASSITAAGDDQVGTLTITASAPTAADAVRRSKAFSDATLAYLRTAADQRRKDKLASLSSSIARLRQAIEDTNSRLQGTTGTEQILLQAQQQAQTAQYQNLFGQLVAAQSESATDVGLTLLQGAQAIPISTGGTSFVSPPTSPVTRAALGLLLGLALAVAGVLLVERLDVRMRTRAATAAGFGLPVVAEVPWAPRRARRHHEILVRTQPDSGVAEAYRGLRASLVLLPLAPTNPNRGRRAATPSREPAHPSHALIVLVASPGPGAGKTSTVANLAAAFAETGKHVVVLDFDQRHPQAHLFFDVPASRGLSDAVATGQLETVLDLIRPTSVPGVGLVTAGLEDMPPGLITTAMGGVIQRVSAAADVVLIDTPPLLHGSDAIDVVPHADVTVLVSGAGRTTPGQAQRAAELLDRLRARVLGVAVIGASTAISAPSGTGRGGRRRSPRRRRRRNEQPAESVLSGMGPEA